MAEVDQLLEETLECLKAHLHPEWGDRAPIDTFNRLVAKNVKAAGSTSNTHLDIQMAEIQSRREQWTTDQLGKLERGHSDPRGADFQFPVVVIEYQGKQRLLDGNHRVNRWVVTKDSRLHEVNIHTVQRDGNAIELPAVKT
jgi:hypothetical protein